jgi:dihydrofolate reductase
MGKLIYTMLTSLDGYVSDREGDFSWAEPDESVQAFVNEQSRSIGTELYGRRMYETMAVWETMELEDEPAVMREYADIWRATDKIVYSSTLADVSSARTRLERSFDTDSVRRLKAESALDISVSGPGLAGAAIRAGLVDELRLFVSPVVVGAGNAFLPGDVPLGLALLGHRRFDNGFVYLAYGVT